MGTVVRSAGLGSGTFRWDCSGDGSVQVPPGDDNRGLDQRLFANRINNGMFGEMAKEILDERPINELGQVVLVGQLVLQPVLSLHYLGNERTGRTPGLPDDTCRFIHRGPHSDESDAISACIQESSSRQPFARFRV